MVKANILTQDVNKINEKVQRKTILTLWCLTAQKTSTGDFLVSHTDTCHDHLILKYCKSVHLCRERWPPIQRGLMIHLFNVYGGQTQN